MHKVRKVQKKDAEAVLAVQHEAWRKTYIPILGEDKVEAITKKRTILDWQMILTHPHSVTFVIENDETQIVGFSSCGPNRQNEPGYPGEIYALYVLPDYHHLGFGKLLFQASAEYLKTNDLDPFIVWIFKDNPACHFYEKMGGRLLAFQPSLFETTVIENGYGFGN